MQLHVFDVEFPCRGLIQRAQHFLRFRGTVLRTIDLKIFTAPRNCHFERRLDLPQVAIERTAEVRQPLVINGSETHVEGKDLNRRLQRLVPQQ